MALPMSNEPASLSPPSLSLNTPLMDHHHQIHPDDHSLYAAVNNNSAFPINPYMSSDFQACYQYIPPSHKEHAPMIPPFNTSPQTQASTSPPSSISSFDEGNPAFSFLASAPEYQPPRIWEHPPDSGTPKPVGNNTSSSLSTAFLLSSSLSTAVVPRPTADPSRAVSGPKRQLPQSAMNSRRPSIEDFHDTGDATPSKRRRLDTVKRTAGACTRCKKLKMKCTFEGMNECARCIAGGHQCVVLGRKPRSPGLREILRKQIREKDAMIDELLNQLNPAPSLATPLSIIPSRLALTDSQRHVYRDVLAWFEKSQNGAKDNKGRIDVSFLEDGSDDDFESDEEQSQADETQNTTFDFSQQLRSLPGASAPAGLLVTTVLESQRQPSPTGETEHEDTEGKDLRIERGIGSKGYFQPGPSANLDLRRLIIERQAAPDILLSGLITYDDVGKLFDLYYRWINPMIPVLDENIHTAAAVLGRCPFLFTVVCALASRYYDEKPEMYGFAMHLAKAAAANAFLDGWKTIEMCQAYILLGAYTPPARRWEEDRYWFYTGIAFRLGIELNLNRMPVHKPTDERNERELLNRLRTWIICYIMDRCICINLGKPFMIPEDEIIRNAAAQFLGFKYQHPNDPYLTSLVELLRIIGRFSEAINPLLENKTAARQDVDLFAMHKVIDDELTGWRNVAVDRCERVPCSEPRHIMQMALMHSVYQYCRLVTFSAGLQQVMKRNMLKEDTVFFTGCLHSASAVLNLMMDGLIPTGFIQHSPEQVFALTAFATVVLLKCLRPEFAPKLDRIQEDRIIELVKRLLSILDSDRGTGNDQHITKRYARFLQHILGPHIAELEARRTRPRVQLEEDEPTNQEEAGSAASASPALENDHASPVTDSPSPGLGLPPDVYGGPVSPGSWDSIFANQDAAPIPPILGFSDTDILAAMMSFSDQSWYS